VFYIEQTQIPFNASLKLPNPNTTEGHYLQGKTKERWQQLCEQTASEKDPKKLLALTAEINRLLEEKSKRLKSNSPPK
jgi:hypothetical protein